MKPSTLQAHLIDEAARLKAAVAAAGSDAVVPSCPEWTASDLLDHVTDVYDHKILSIRLLREPSEADARQRSGSPSERFDAALAELLAEFDDRGPDSLAYTWYGPDQTVGFWIRRLACETVVHRADAELAAGRPIGAIDEDLALDAIEEILSVMVAWGSRAYREWLADDLAANAGLVIAFEAGPRSWTVRVRADGAELSEGSAPDAGATVAADPGTLLMWLWRRVGADAPDVNGDRAAATAFYDLVGSFTD